MFGREREPFLSAAVAHSYVAASTIIASAETGQHGESGRSIERMFKLPPPARQMR